MVRRCCQYDAGGVASELDGVVTQGPIGRRQVGSRIVSLDGFDKLVVVVLGPEVVAVGKCSVMAVVGT